MFIPSIKKEIIILGIFKEIYEYRQMIYSLVKKDLRGRYKGSVLGFLWTFINPLLQLIVYSIVFSSVMRVTNVEKYYIFLFVVLIPWNFFASSVTGGCNSIVGNKNLITKIYFPREVIPFSYVTSCFVNMLLCFIVIFLVLIISGVGVSLLAVLWLPLVFVIEYFLCLGFSLIVSSVTVYFRDLEHILGIVMMAWMYFTPVIYSINDIPPHWKKIFMLNPMCHIITAYRDILYYKQLPDISSLLIIGAVSLAVFFVGMGVFGSIKKHFAETL